MIKQFYFKQFNLIQVIYSLSSNAKQFYLSYRPYQVLPLRVSEGLVAMAMKGYFASPKAPVLLESHHKI